MTYGRVFYFLVLCFLSFSVCAQTLVADFTLPGTVCQQENLRISNVSSGATSYEWDFCLGDIASIKSSSNQATLSNLNYGTNLKLLFDQGKWYGFVLSENNSRLIRLDFGNDLASVPTAVDVGNPGGLLAFPEGLDIIKAGVNWYAFVGHLDLGRGVVRLNFGSSLENIPTATNIGDFGFVVRFRDLRIVNQDGNYILVLSNFNDNTIVRINFGSDITNSSPTILNTSPIPDVFLPIGIDLVKKGDDWIAHWASYGNNKLIQLNFGNDLLSTPTIEAAYSLNGLSQPRNNRILLEGDTYYSIVSNESGGVQIIDFKDLNPSSAPVNLNLSGLPTAIGFDIVRINGQEIFYGVPALGNTLKQVVFEASCGASINYSESIQPAVAYSVSGIKRIELVALSASQRSSAVKTTTTSSSVAPVSAITTDGSVCAGSAIGFTASSIANIQTFSWDFGDSNFSTGSSTNHSYSTGNYIVELLITGTNGCVNFDQMPIEVFNAPTSAFSLPAVPIFCTNQPYTFTNESVFSSGTNPSFQWKINGENASTDKDLTLPFTNTSAKEITLQVSIPGCNSITTQTLNSIQVGPVVGFLQPENNCQNTGITFINQTTGPVSNYVWNFDDGNTSTQENPMHGFANAGSYNVTLHATNSSGCQNFITKPITIYSKPQPNFSIDLPPFSCAGSPSQFNDLTPSLTDSNITSRLWSFGDVNNGTAIQTNPTYTYNQAGDYPVSLEVTSNFGCSSTIQKTITIHPSPTINFTNTPACLNQPTQFTDASGVDVKAWLWTIQNSSYTTRNVTHEFSTTGLQNAMLTVTATNNCVSEISKSITIPVPISIDFTTQGMCATKPAVFTEINSGGADPAVSSTWDFAGQPGSGSPAQHVFSSVGSYPVKLSSTRLSGCVYSVTKSVNIIQPPVARFTMTPESGGVPLAVGFTNTSSSATNFLWKFNDVSNTTSTQSSPSFVFDQLGTYAVELIASNSIGCTDSVKKDVQVVVPQINAMLSGFWLKGNADGTLNATVTVENKGNITITNPEVYLDLSGVTEVEERISGTIPPNQSITHTLTSTILPVNLKYACAEVFITGDANTFDNRECTNLENEITFVQPYPNPASDIIYLDWINQNLESIQVIIYNSTGQAVLNQTYSNLLQGLNQVEINVSQLTPGIYLASYSTGNNLFSFRFSVNR